MFTTSSGTDELYGHTGDDSFTINGTGNKTISGGSGTDSLSIAYSGVGITSFSSISKDASTGYISFVDDVAGTISAQNVEALSIGGNSYGDISSNNPSGFSNVSQLLFNNSVTVNGAKVGVFYNVGSTGGSNSQNLYYAQNLHLAGQDIRLIGSSGDESLNLTFSHNNETRADIGGMMGGSSGDYILEMGAGDDVIRGFQPINTDSVSLGTGNDRIHLNINGDGTTDKPNYGSLNIGTLDGGAGSDWLVFDQAYSGGDLTLATGGATNFENLAGSSGNDTLKGDNNDNVIGGTYNDSFMGSAGPSVGGTDTVYGYGGNDTIVAGGTLYGGAGKLPYR